MKELKDEELAAQSGEAGNQSSLITSNIEFESKKTSALSERLETKVPEATEHRHLIPSRNGKVQ